MVGGAWQATVHRLAKRQTQLKKLNRHVRRVCPALSGVGWGGGAGVPKDTTLRSTGSFI